MRGISLTEIAIALLTAMVFTLLILRLLDLSRQTESRAEALIRAADTASALITAVGQKAHIDAFLSDGALLPYTLTHSPDKSVIVHKYYDAQWNPAAEADGLYMIKLAMKPDPVYGEALYRIHAAAYRCGLEQIFIADFETAKFFGK